MVNLKQKAVKLLTRCWSGWVRLAMWWHAGDRRYGWRWRVANGAMAVLLLAAVILPVAQNLVQSNAYALSADTIGLVGQTNSALTKQLTYDAKDSQYQFNKDGISSDDMPAALQHATVGTPTDKNSSTYALDVPTDLSKGVTYHDTNSHLSFSLVPQFKAMQGKDVAGHLVYPLSGGTQAIYTLKGNGLKEDIVVQKAASDTMTFSYKLNLPDTLEAKAIPNSGGAIGIYSADPALFGDITFGSPADQQKVEKARVNGAKTYLVFGLPAPVIKVADGGSVGDAWARFELKGDTLSVVASGLSKLTAPMTIDPSVLVSSATDFSSQGNNEGMITLGSSGGGVAGSVGAWQSGSSTSFSQHNSAAVAYNGYIYSLGGEEDHSFVVHNDVQYAPLNADGTVGTWQYTYNSASSSSFVGGFTNVRLKLGAVVNNGYIYVLGGGNDQGVYYNDVQYAPLNADGTVGTWQYTYNSASSSSFVGGFTTPRLSPDAVINSGYIYVLGGQDSNGSYNDVQYAPLNADGTVGTWKYTYNSASTSTFTNGFTTPRADFGTAVYKGFLYVFGGVSLVNDPRGGLVPTQLNDVQYAPLNADGTVGTWQYTYNSASSSSFVGGFTTPRQDLGAGISDGYMYVVGGTGSSSTTLNDVQYAPLNADGTVGAWQASTGLSSAQTNFGFTIYNNHLYIVAGMDGGFTSMASVTYAAISTGVVEADGTASRSDITGGSFGAWTTSSNNLTTAGERRGAVTYNGYLYSVGGDNSSGGAIEDVQYAQIKADGSIDTWQTATSLPSTAIIKRAAAYNGYLYAVGSYTGGSSNVTTTYYARINADGSIESTWHRSATNLPVLLVAERPQVYNGYMYLMGGYDGTNGVDTNSTYYAPINADGSVGTWTLNATSFTNVRESIGTAVYNGHLYVMGGLNYVGGVFTYFNDVQYAPINADGSVGTWSATASFTTARTNVNAIAHNGYLYLFGGSNSSNILLGDVQYAPIYANGSLGAWSTGTALPTTTRNAGVVAYNDYLYLVGGFNSAVMATTSYTQISAASGPPPTGSVDFGNTTAGTLNDTGQKSHITCSEYAAPYSGTVSSISLNVNSIAGTNTAKKYEVAVYGSDGSGGAPGTKVASSAAGTLVVGWNTLSVSATVSGGTNYWLCWNNNSGSTSTNNVTYGSGSNPSAQSSSTITYTTWSDSPAMITGTTQYAVYATMTASPSTMGTLGSWGPGTALTTARQVGASVVYNGYIYVMGGNNGTSALSDVQYAQIKSDGTLGSWGTAGDFGTARQYFSAVASNGYLYILGGLLSGGAGNLNTVQYAQIKSDGTLGSFNPAASFTTARASLGAAAYNGYVYLFGGTDGATNVYQDVWYGQIGSDGNISSWVQATSMNTKRTGAEAVVYNGYLYALGGTNGTTDQNTVEYAQIKSDGSLGGWTTSGSTLGTARDHFGAVAANGYMYVFGGYNGALTAAAEFAPINADGSLGSWSSTTAMTSARQAFGFAAYNGYVYSIGGNVSNAASTSVIYAPLNSIALIGHYSKLLDLGSTVTVTGITYTGTLGNGINDIGYRAANSAGAFTYTGTAGDLTSSCTGGLANVRYILVTITFDDSMDGTGPDSSGAHANVSDFTVNYKTGHPVPAQRLRGGKTLQGGVLAPLDIGAGGGGCSA